MPVRLTGAELQALPSTADCAALRLISSCCIQVTAELNARFKTWMVIVNAWSGALAFTLILPCPLPLLPPLPPPPRTKIVDYLQLAVFFIGNK